VGTSIGSVREPKAIQVDTWATLRHKTAWILLGVIDAADDTWITDRRHLVLTGPHKGSSAIPRPGDILQLTQETELVILAYRASGEAKRLISPAQQAFASSDDLTGLKLSPSSTVIVRDNQLEDAMYGLRGVWVRVVPTGEIP
jgi:hypothetical protein